MINDDEILKRVQTLISEREQARKERDEAQIRCAEHQHNCQELQAKCAEMRDALEQSRMVVSEMADITSESRAGYAFRAIKHALSADCGRGWKSAQQIAEMLEPTITLLKMMDPTSTQESLNKTRELARLEALQKETASHKS